MSFVFFAVHGIDRVSAVILTAKHAKIAKSFSGLFFRVRVVRGSCFSSRVFVVILTAKDFFVFFSLFVPFACFAVQDFQTACPLEFLRP